MTDQMMFEAWADLLRPQLPEGAEFGFKPRRRVITVTWTPQFEPPTRCPQSLAISFTQLAWKSYRGARSARRARADSNLVELVKAALAQHDSDCAYGAPAADLQVGVAAVDIFPPPASVSQSAGHGLRAG